MNRNLSAVAAASLLTFGCAARSPSPAAASEAPPKVAIAPLEMHRLEYTLVVDDGSQKVTRKYALGLEERRGGEIRAGGSTPLVAVTGLPSPRVDTGVVLRSSYVTVGDALALHVDFESSQADAARAIHKVSARGDALLVGKKEAEVLRAHDPIGNVDYVLTATATRLR